MWNLDKFIKNNKLGYGYDCWLWFWRSDEGSV